MKGLKITITQFARLHKILSAKPYKNPLKFNHLCRLVPVHGCNLALLPDNLMRLTIRTRLIALTPR